MKYKLLIFAIIVILGKSSLVAAQDNDQTTYTPLGDEFNHHFYLGARAGWANYKDACIGNELDCTEDTFGYGLYGGYQILPWFALETGMTDYGHPKARYSNDNVKVDLIGYELSGKFNLPLYYGLSAYTRLGASYLDLKKESTLDGKQSGNAWKAMAAAGLQYDINRNWSMRTEYQLIDGIGNSRVDQADLHFISLGLTYRFQSTPQVFIAEPIPEPASTPEPQPELPVYVTHQLSSRTLFSSNVSKLKDPRELDALIETIKSGAVENIYIIGHTDSTGSEQYNQRLSEKRAYSVAAYLVEQGIPEQLLNVTGAGELNPIASNKTASGREQNRRVEIKFEMTKEQL
ncbi:OmpA family protein [Vibrio rumoiensis]|uniref:OmpA family protein n=1 Tax=Vibrio rumoiensis TaxID=76258 RepID=UPI003AA89D0F